MRIIGTIVVASAALLTGVLSAAAAPGTDDGTTITPHAFAKGIDVQTGRSASVDWADGINDKYRFSIGFTSPCDTARIQELFCRDAD